MPAALSGTPQDIVRIDDGELKELDPRSVTVERLAGAIFSGITSLVLLGGATALTLAGAAASPAFPFGVAVPLVALLLWWSFYWPAVSHRHKSYVVSAKSIEIRKGVIWRRVVSVPRSRVQHTDVTQGPLERRFGIGTLVIHTAGTEHSKVDLSGLEHSIASHIRDHLLPLEEGDAV